MKYYFRCGKDREEACKLRQLDLQGGKEIDKTHKIALNPKWEEEDENGDLDVDRTLLVWEVDAPMAEQLPDQVCPACDHPAVSVIHRGQTVFYERGYGYKDRAGCRRDMNLYKLTKDDPYGGMRESGESDHLANKIRAGGKFNPKRQYYVPSKKGGYVQ